MCTKIRKKRAEKMNKKLAGEQKVLTKPLKSCYNKAVSCVEIFFDRDYLIQMWDYPCFKLCQFLEVTVVYQVGDYVVKAYTGVCRVEEITHPEGMDVDKNKLYYLLIPLSDEKMKIYVPTDSQARGLRKALNSEEAWEVINSIPEIEEVQIDNEKQREQKYKEAIRDCNPKMLVGIIKTMYRRKQRRTAQGKKDTAMDERYFKLAEEYLYSELAFALDRNKNEMCKLIEETIHKNNL